MKASTVSAPLVQAIENAWAAIQSVNSDVPDVVVTLGSGNVGHGLKLGHFAANVWNRGEDDVHELFVGAEGLQRGAAALLATLLHEAAHAAAEARNIKDTSRQGRYHNTNFKNIAEEFGIKVNHDSVLGWSDTEIPETTQSFYDAAILDLDASMTAYRKGFESILFPAPGTPVGTAGTIRTPRKTTRRDTGVSATCGCRKIRASRSAFELGSIVCNVCGNEFQES
jgi:hypothetical protein